MCDSYSAFGKSPCFAMWIGAALGCCVNPKLVPLAEDEYGQVCVQKVDGSTLPLVFHSDHTLVVVMPMRLDEGVEELLERYKKDRLCRMRKMKVVKPQTKKDPALWRTALVKRKAA